MAVYLSDKIPRQTTPEIPGNSRDLEFLNQDRWLIDSEVKYLLIERNSLIYLYMIFVATKESLQILCRFIDTYSSHRKAETFAKIFQRGIRKDARGTLQKNGHDYSICSN